MNTSAAPWSSRARWRFSLRGLFLMIGVIGLALTDFRLRGGDLDDILPILQSLVSVGILIGLFTQSRDFRRELKRGGLSADARSGLWFAIIWRCAVVLMLVEYHVLEHMDAQVDFEEWYASYAGRSIDIVFYLAMIAVISSTRHIVSRRFGWQPSILRYSLVCLLAGIYFSIVLYYQLFVHHLVYIAIRGIELAHGPMSHPFLDGLHPLPIQRTQVAFWLGMFTPLLVPVNYVLIYWIARERTRRVWRVLLTPLFGLALLGMTGAFLWNYLVALPAAAPLMIDQPPEAGPWDAVLIALPCFLFLTTTIAYRWTARHSLVDKAATADFPPVQYYLHERRWLLGLLATLIVFEIAAFYVVRRNWIEFFDLFTYLFISDYGLCAFPAFLVVLLQATLAGWRTRHTLPPVDPPELPLRRFALVWLAVTATTLVAIPVLAIYGFALWLAPWYL